MCYDQVNDTSKHQTAAWASFETAEACSNTSPTEAKGCIPVESSTRCPAQPPHGPLPLQDHSERRVPSPQTALRSAPSRPWPQRLPGAAPSSATAPRSAPPPPAHKRLSGRHRPPRPRRKTARLVGAASCGGDRDGAAVAPLLGPAGRGPAPAFVCSRSRCRRPGAGAGSAQTRGGVAAARQLRAHGEGNGAVSRLEQFQP